MNDLYYEYFQDGVCLNSFDCVVFHKMLGAQTRQKLKTDCDI